MGIQVEKGTLDGPVMILSDTFMYPVAILLSGKHWGIVNQALVSYTGQYEDEAEDIRLKLITELERVTG